jgi:hypothetical protein
MPNRSSEIIRQLAAGVDIDRVLREQKISFERALKLLGTRQARREISARRKLAVIHTHLVAHRFSPYAVQRLCELLSDEKAEMRFKGAVAVLSIVGLSRLKAPAGKRVKESFELSEPTAESAELLGILATIISGRKKAQKQLSQKHN